MIGRLAFGPKYVDDTPGWPLRVSPSELPRRSTNSSPLSTLIGAAISFEPNGLPVTMTGARIAGRGDTALAGVAGGAGLCA